MKTLFQKIIDREEPGVFLYEDEDYVVLDNKYPKTPIHYLIIPKRLIPSIPEATEEDIETIGGLFILAKKFAEENEIKDYKLVFNTGKHQDIPHLHLHFLAGDID